MRKYLPIGLALAALAGTGIAPASARIVHRPAYHHAVRKLYNYDPGYRYAPDPAPGVYPNPIPVTGTEANRAEQPSPGY
jgi:hypothetical protein